ncbi:hypothetical protein ACTQ45_05805 [Fundicoccus sp. Sow4_D5]|uniref:hypothetical protein n=1 Tax=Fundicoccus sp. Sow4_D5 TaxID=3438782 RepID=UPI003F8E2C41
MKKLLRTMLCLLCLMPVFANLSSVSVQAEEEFPYEGIYLTDENRAIWGFVFFENGVQVVVRHEELRNSETRNMERYTELIQVGRLLEDGLTGMIDPSMDAEDIAKWYEKNNIHIPDYAKIYSDVAEKITPTMRREEIDAMIDAQIPSIDYSYLNFNYNNPVFYQYIQINAPTIRRSQDLWLVELGNQKLFRFEHEDNTDGSKITDDYGVTYSKRDFIEIVR